MGLLNKLKSALGLDGADSGRGGTGRHGQDVDVTVEREPSTASEAAVKGTETAAGGTESATASAETTTTTTSESTTTDAADADASTESEADDSSAAEPAAEPGGGEGVSVTELNGIGPAYGDRLADAGVDDVADLAAADAEALSDEIGLGAGRIQGWIEQAKEY